MLPTTSARFRPVLAGNLPVRMAAVWGSRPVSQFRLHLRNPRFWIIQAMVLVVTLGHLITEVTLHPHLGPAYFIPASLLFFPILYASLNFGREGAIPTAVWAAGLSIPNVVLLHEGLERVGELFQLSTVIALAVVVAGGVDKERVHERARLASERRYRALFEAAGEPIIVVDGAGEVREANDAAARLLGCGLNELRGAAVSDVLGVSAESLTAGTGEDALPLDDIAVVNRSGIETWIQPVCTGITTADGAPLAQAILRDVTERRGLQRFAREIVRAQEEERARISRDLHDVCLQSAVLICRSLDTAAESVEAASGDGVMSALAQARTLAEAMSNDLRRFSRDLRPAILDDLGLAPALRRLAGECAERAGIDCRFTLRGRPRLLHDRAAELVLYRIVQEALRNTERHSGASEVGVLLRYEPSKIVVVVTDNGCGFATSQKESGPANGHLGILGMQERARLVRGECVIRSRPQLGTIVEASVPVEG